MGFDVVGKKEGVQLGANDGSLDGISDGSEVADADGIRLGLLVGILVLGEKDVGYDDVGDVVG